METRTHILTGVTRSIAFVLLMIGLNFQGSPAMAQDHTISYQGTLTQNDIHAMDGLYKLKITLYGDTNGETAIWSDNYSTEVKNGIFNIQLGSGKTLPASKTLDRQLWLGISINGTAEQRPLTKLDAAPFALNVADQAVTIKKLAPDVVGILTRQNPQWVGYNCAGDPNVDKTGGGANTNVIGGGCGNRTDDGVVTFSYSSIIGGYHNMDLP